MSEADGSIIIDLQLKMEELDKQVSSLKSKLGKETSGLGSKIQAGMKKIGDGLVDLGKKSIDKVVDLSKKAATTVKAGLMAATAGAVAFGKSAVSAFSEANEAAAQLNKMLLNTGSSAESIEHLQSAISQMAQKSVLADSNLTAMAKQLSTFDLSAAGIEQLLPALADMAVAEKGLNASMDDYVGIAQMMGKAVQGDVSGLTRMGFIIEDEVIEAIKNASTEEERLAMINEILGNTYADLAEEMKSSFAGQAQIAKNVFGQITEAFGGATAEMFLKPILEDINNAFGDMDWAGIFTKDENGIVVGLSIMFTEALKIMPDIINTFIDWINQIFSAIGFTFLHADWSEAISSIAGLTTYLIDAFWGVFTSVSTFITQNESFLSDELGKIIEHMTTGIAELAPALSAAIGSIVNMVFDNSDQLVECAITVIDSIITVISENLPDIIAAAILLISKLATAIGEKAPEMIGTIVDGLIEFFVNVLPEQLPMIIKAGIQLFVGLVKGLVQAIPTIIEQIPILVEDIVNALLECLPELIDGFIQLFMALVENLPTVVLALIDAAPKIIVALTKGMIEAGPVLWDGCKKLFATLAGNLPEWLGELWEKVKEWTAIITLKIALWLVELWGDVKKWFSELPDKLAEWGVKIWEGVSEWLASLPEKIGYFLGFVATKVTLLIVQLWNYLCEKVPELITAVVTFVSELPGKIWNWLVVAYNKTVDWLTDTWNTMTTKISETIEAVVKYFSEMPDKIKKWYTDAIEKTKTWLGDMYTKAKEGIKKVYDTIINKIKEIPEKMLEMGKKIVEGLWDGINNAKDWLMNKISEFVSGIVDGAKDALGIHSPSRVFAQIGEFTAAGLGEGFSDQMDAVRRQIRGEMRDLVNVSQASTLAGMGLSGSTAYNQSNVFNFNVPTVSPYEIERAMKQAQYVR